MKRYQLNLLVSLVLVFSFLYSDYAKLPSNKESSLKNNKNKKSLINNDSEAKNIKKNKNKKSLNNNNEAKHLKKKKKKEKTIKNPDLKAELLALEKEFQKEKEELKEEFLAEKEELRQSYRSRKRSIYEKYGVNPPQNNNSDSDPNGLWKSIE